nr:ABC transporter ATP-binding protein [Lachnospiraceae bacterium]
MKKLLPYLKEYKKECILAPAFKMSEAILELFVPLVVAAMIDHGMGNRSRGYLVGMSMVLLLLALVGLGVSVTAQYFAAKAAVGFATKLRYALFSHLQSFSYTEIDQMGASTMITRMTLDITQAQNGVNMVLRLLLRSPFVVLGAMVMAFTIDPWSATLFVAVIFGLSAVVFLIMNFHIPMMKQIQQKVDQLTQAARENLTGVRVIRAFVKEKEEIGRFNARNEQLLLTQERTGKVSALLNPLTYVIVNLAIIFLIHTGAVQIDRGVLSQGEVVALYNYMTQILVELIKFANLTVTINKALASGNRIVSALSLEPSMQYPGSAAGSGGASAFTPASEGIAGDAQPAVSFEA